MIKGVKPKPYKGNTMNGNKIPLIYLDICFYDVEYGDETE